MKNKKKVLIIGIIAVVLITAVVCAGIFIFGSDKEEPSLKQVLKEKLNAYETDLSDSTGSFKTNDDVADYLLNWAKNKEISATKDETGNVIFTIPATEEGEDVSPVAVICSFDANNMDSHTIEMASAMCISNNLRANGKITVVFMAEDGTDKYGAEGFDINHFTDDTQVLFLNDTNSYRVSTVTAGYRQYRFTDEIDYDKAKFSKAYKITISNCPSVPMGEGSAAIPNPIKTLGNLLANFKSTSLLHELAAFTGGSDASVTPASASITVLISDSDVEKFTKRMDTAIEKFNEKYAEKYPDIKYTYKEVSAPSNALSKDDTENVISLLYTAFNGVYYKDDDGNVVSFTNIGKIRTNDGKLTIHTAAMGTDNDNLIEISESYKTICGLCDMTYRRTSSKALYNGTKLTEDFLTAFETSYLEFTDDESLKVEASPVYSSCSVLHDKNDELQILFLGITEKTKHKLTGSMVTYIHDLCGYEE